MRGLTEFINFTEQLSRDVEDQAKDIVKQATLQTERNAKQLAPVDTGYMRNSISSSFTHGGLVGTVTANAEYALFVEFGTTRQPAQPFMFPSFHQNIQQFINDLQGLLNGAGGS